MESISPRITNNLSGTSKANITAIVPARSKSKRVPGKNIKELNGKPLIFHTLDSLLGHHEINEIIFTSDSLKYLDIVDKAYGAKIKLVHRPPNMATDKVKVYDEVVRLAQLDIITTDWFLLCLPTSPLRNYQVVKEILSEWNTKHIPMFSACEYPFPIQFAFDLQDDGSWRPLLDQTPMLTGNTRSQDIKAFYRPNGAMYIHKTKVLSTQKTFYIGAYPFIMTGDTSIDIDSELDFQIAENMLKYLDN